jgi:threonine dehydratase
VICASAGNHAQGVALAARRMGCRAVVVMPVTTPKVKIDAVQALGGQVVLQGESYSDAYAHALEMQQAQGMTFVHPFDDPDVIAGQGTVAMEILRQHQGPIDAVFVAIGGGGLISGIAAYVKAVRPEVQVIGVQTVDSDAMMQSVRRGRRVQLTDVGLFSDGPRPSAWRARWWTTTCASTPTRSAPRSRTSSRTRAASSSPRARWAWRRSSSTWPRTSARAAPSWPSPAART